MPNAFSFSSSPCLLACHGLVGKGEREEGRTKFEHFSARERVGSLIG